MTNQAEELKAARRAIWQVAQMGGVHTQLLMQYIGLFAKDGEKLPFERINMLLAEVAEIWIDWTLEAWNQAAEEIVKANKPLSNHDLLLDALALIADYQRNSVEVAEPKEKADYWQGVGEIVSNSNQSTMYGVIPTVPPPPPEQRKHDPPQYPKPTEQQKQQRHIQVTNMIKHINKQKFTQ